MQARELRLAELKEARELHELELKAEKEKALLEAEKEAAACKHELKMAGLGRLPPLDRASAFDPARNIRFVLPFLQIELVPLARNIRIRIRIRMYLLP